MPPLTSPTHRTRARTRSLRARGLPLVWALLVAPQLLLPTGAIICFETCGEWEITGEHASHSCDHAPETTHTGCGDHSSHADPAHHDHAHHDHAHHDHVDHDHSGAASPSEATPVLSHDHEAIPGGSSCLDLRTGDETTAAKVVAAQVLAPPIDHSDVITLTPASRAPTPRGIRERHPPLLFADCYLSPLRV